MKQTSKAFRALSPKRSQFRPPPTSGSNDDEPDPASPTGNSPSIALQGRASSSRTRQRTRRRRNSGAAELPEVEKTEEEFKRDWGISRDREEILLAEFRKAIEEVVGPLQPMFDRMYLRRFLRARQHDLGRAKDMFLAHLKWRQDNGVDRILQDFHFQERDAFLSLYPQGYHKTDKMGRPVYIQHIGAIKIKAIQDITTEERMIKFHVQEYERCLKYIFPACSRKAGCHMDQTFAIMDVKGVGLKHLTGDVKNILSRITETDQNNYPETLGKTVIINAPTVFKMIWAMVRPMLDVRTQAKIEVAPSDYMKVLLRYIDADNIPEYLGGKSKGSLIDDVGPWKEPHIMALVQADISRREQLHMVEDGSNGESMDLERWASSGPLPPSLSQQAEQHPMPRAGEQTGAANVAVHAGGAITAAVSPGAPVQLAPFGTPFSMQGAGSLVQQQSTDYSEMDEFQDALSRRQSFLTTSGSSASLNFQGDTISPADKLPAVGVPPCLPWQQPPRAVQYSGQYPPPPGLQLEVDGQGNQAAQRGQPPQLEIALPTSSIQARLQSSGNNVPELFVNGGITAQMRVTSYGTPVSVTGLGGKTASSSMHVQQRMTGMPSPPLQISFLMRVRALEEMLPETERHVRRYLPAGAELPSKAVAQGTLLHRVEALERAMDTLLRAQAHDLEDRAKQRQGPRSTEQSNGSCCCCMM